MQAIALSFSRSNLLFHDERRASESGRQMMDRFAIEQLNGIVFDVAPN